MFFKEIIKLVAPHVCFVCGRTGELACAGCLESAVTRKAATCYRCNRLSPEFKTCHKCRPHSRLRRVIVASQYEGVVKQLIHMLKYENGVDAAPLLAELIGRRLSPLSSQYDVIVPVPIQPRKYRQRGYNQAELLARSLSKRLGLIVVRVLYRRGSVSQVGANRTTRLTQLEGKVYLHKSQVIAGKRILLVDDVVTTGGTLNECAKVLKAGGAKSVDAAVVAKH